MSDKNQPVVHAVVPSAGRGTRFLPITKSVPKEMLPVVDRPSIEYIVREATDAGIEDILFVTRAGKQSIEDYFDAEPGLEADLEKAGKEKALEYELLRKMIQVRAALGGTVVALLKVTPEQATAYASTAVEVLPIPEGVDLEEGQLMRITDVTEKPPLEEVKSEYAVVGRYLLDPAVFTALENIEPGAGGEYQLTDGYARMIDLPEEEGGGLYGVVIDERRFDTGDKLGYLEANVTLALEDPALGAELKEFLRSKLED